MIYQNSPFVIPLLLSAAITGTLAFVSLKRRNDPVIPPFILLMCATTYWALCYAIQLVNVDLSTQILITAIEYPAIVTVPVAWLLIVLRYTGHEHLTTKRYTTALFIVPAIVVLLVITNPYHFLYYSGFSSAIVYGATIWHFSHGPLFWIQAVYGYLCLALAFVLIGIRFFTSPAIYRRQIIILFLAAGIPVVANLVFLFGIEMFPGIDITPFTFTLMGIVLALGIFRFQLFTVGLVAYPVIFTAIGDAIIVLDRNDRVCDLNPAAGNIIRRTGRNPIGEPAGAILPPDLIDSLVCGDPGSAGVRHAVITGNDGIPREYEVTCRPIMAPTGVQNGRLFMFRDETEKLNARRAIEMTNRKLNLLSSITRHDMQNKLTTLSGYIELAKTEKDEAVLHGYLLIMEKTTRVFQEELAFTRDYQDLGVKVPSWQEVRALVREKAANLPTLNTRMEIAIQPDTLEVYADPLLGKVFYNLIDNSLRYAGEKMSEIRITTREEGGAMVLVFEDNGAGIPVKDKERLFTKGFGKNTGLGLFLSREILAITGITITENGEPGKGARFEISVPKGMYRVRKDDSVPVS